MTSPEKIALGLAALAVFSGLFFASARYSGTWRPVTLAGATASTKASSDAYGHIAGRWQRHGRHRGGCTGERRIAGGAGVVPDFRASEYRSGYAPHDANCQDRVDALMDHRNR